MRFASSQCEYTQSQHLTENAAWKLDLDAPAGSMCETKTMNRTAYEPRLHAVRQTLLGYPGERHRVPF